MAKGLLASAMEAISKRRVATEDAPGARDKKKKKKASKKKGSSPKKKVQAPLSKRLKLEKSEAQGKAEKAALRKKIAARIAKQKGNK